MVCFEENCFGFNHLTRALNGKGEGVRCRHGGTGVWGGGGGGGGGGKRKRIGNLTRVNSHVSLTNISVK